MRQQSYPQKRNYISIAVRDKFLILLLLTLALIFDVAVINQPNPNLLDNQSSPEVPTSK